MELDSSLTSLDALIRLLRQPILRTRTGLWLMPLEMVGREADIAVQLGIDAADIRNVVLERLPENTRFVRLAAEKVINALNDIANDRQARSDCVLVYNVDLLLAGLNRAEREAVWEATFLGLPHRTRALVIAVPETATELVPPGDGLEKWGRDDRLVWSRLIEGQ